MPATYTAYPTSTAVSAYVAAAGVSIPTGFGLTQFGYHVDAAIDEWERLTEYRPFLAATASASFYYDPPGPNRTAESRGGYKRLLLDRGFTAIGEVRNGITTTDTAGTVLTAGTDYRPWPKNAPSDSQPYTAIDFVSVQYGEPESVKVTGTAGYATAINSEVFQSVLELAAGDAMAAFMQGIASGAVEWHEGDVSERGSVELIEKLGEQWRTKARTTALQYRRVL
jgi:hypothetical protein